MTATDVLDADQVRETIRDFAHDNDGVARVRAGADARAAGTAPGDDRFMWQRLCVDLGVSALVVPEQHGGLAAGERATAVVLEELGYRLEPAPVWSGLNAARALAAAAQPDSRLADLLSGDLVGTVAWAASGPSAPPEVRLVDGRLAGVVRFVPDAGHADVLVVPVDTDSGPALALVDDPQGIAPRRHPRPGTDLVRTVADVDLTGAAARIVVSGAAAVGRLNDLADVSLAAELIGGARACLDRTVEYVCIREQFGRLIGGFQALQHACSRLALRIEQAQAVSSIALHAADDGDDAVLARVAPLARAMAAETFAHGAGTLVHLHGGIGFTWEHDAHLFFRRAHAARSWGGTPAQHFAEAARRGAASILTAT